MLLRISRFAPRASLGRVALSALACSSLALVALPVTPASAAAVPRYANCTAMHKNKAFLGGIAKVGAKDKRASGHARYKPYVNTAYYDANIKMDADHDGIACEQ